MVTSTNQAKYIIDTSSILSQKDNEPHRRTINKTLWKHIDELITQSRIVTCSEIIDEVNDEELKKWFTGLHGDILPIDDEIQENVRKVVTSNPQLVDFKQIKSSGDAFLIATAMKYGLTVITEESKKGEKKIPFVCNNLNVPCTDILGLCELEGWSFSFDTAISEHILKVFLFTAPQFLRHVRCRNYLPTPYRRVTIQMVRNTKDAPLPCRRKTPTKAGERF